MILSFTFILPSFFWIFCATWSLQYFSWRKSQKIRPTSEFTHMGWISVENPAAAAAATAPAAGSAPPGPSDSSSSLCGCRKKPCELIKQIFKVFQSL